MYQGDYLAASSVVFNFNTAAFSDGSPITLAGTPALSAYKNSTTESTAGITLTVDYDSRTGMHHVVVDTSADGTFYAAGNDFDVIITAGTVGGTSVVGRKVGSFSLENRTQKADVRKWNGTAVATPATAGIPDVNAKAINNVATTNVTTINANLGQTQPVNFTGTGASALVKVDAIDWNSVAVTGMPLPTASYTTPPTTAQIATGVWQDTTAGDFTVAGSIGKSLFTSGNAPGAASGLALVGSAMTLSAAYDFAKGTVAVTEAYNADGAAPTPVQALMVIMQMLTELSFAGTTGTVKKLDGSTTAFTLTINSATTPTSITRST